MNPITPREWIERKKHKTILGKPKSIHCRKFPTNQNAEDTAIRIIRKNGEIMPGELARQMGVTEAAMRKHLLHLIKRGLIAQRYYRREYYLT